MFAGPEARYCHNTLCCFARRGPPCTRTEGVKQQWLYIQAHANVKAVARQHHHQCCCHCRYFLPSYRTPPSPCRASSCHCPAPGTFASPYLQQQHRRRRRRHLPGCRSLQVACPQQKQRRQHWRPQNAARSSFARSSHIHLWQKRWQRDTAGPLASTNASAALGLVCSCHVTPNPETPFRTYRSKHQVGCKCTCRRCKVPPARHALPPASLPACCRPPLPACALVLLTPHTPRAVLVLRTPLAAAHSGRAHGRRLELWPPAHPRLSRRPSHRSPPYCWPGTETPDAPLITRSRGAPPVGGPYQRQQHTTHHHNDNGAMTFASLHRRASSSAPSSQGGGAAARRGRRRLTSAGGSAATTSPP